MLSCFDLLESRAANSDKDYRIFNVRRDLSSVVVSFEGLLYSLHRI